MKNVCIDVFALKSNRKNAKYEVKTFRCYPAEEKLKKKFTKNDRAELEQWAIAMTEKGLECFQVVVVDGTKLEGENTVWCRMHDFLPQAMDFFRASTTAINFMNLYNRAEGYQTI